MPRFALVLLCLFSAAPALLRSAEPHSVRIEICENNIPRDNTFPATPPAATETFTEPAFALFELPQKYISTGIRADRPFPTLVRASATVTLPAGKHRLLLRARGQTRVLLDGHVILTTPFDQPRQFKDGNAGELPVEEQNTFIDLGSGFRFAPPGNREELAEITFPATPVTIVLETLIGGVLPSKSKIPPTFRPELGETVLALSLAGTTDWHLLAPDPSRRIRYTDTAWSAYEASRRLVLDQRNAAARAARRAAESPYWDRRRAAATAYLASTRDEPIPALPAGYPAQNPVDHFLAARLAQVSAELRSPSVHPSTAAGAPTSLPPAPSHLAPPIDFHRDIKPILEHACYTCHSGAKVKGGLRLDLHSAALKGGEADGPALVPHQPHASALLRRITSTDPDEVMPAKGDPLPPKDIALLRRWIEEGARWPEFAVDRLTLTAPADDLTLLRRLHLDLVGVVPSPAEITAFQRDLAADPIRTPQSALANVITRLLADPRWADHQMAYWLDVLAENPNLINPTLNNTGPFRGWLYESLLDNKPVDLLVTELLRLEGSERFGGPAGFAIASQNDVPFAAKGIIVSSAFLGVEMKCARCHDAPTHLAKQKDLFQLAALLEQKPLKVPATSSVPLDHLSMGGRQPLIEVTLPPGTTVAPAWPFPEFISEETASALAQNPASPRDRLAALVTSPQNERFAQVIANRLWQRFMGRGLVATVGDWEKSTPTHPALLRWLGRELVRSNYDLKALARLIVSSHAYQRAVDPHLTAPSPLFTAPAPRRIGAEQLVDSLFAATGKPFDVEPVNLDVDSVRTIDNALDLGRARRAWMLGSTSNERDRPSLMLPRMQAVAEVLEVFGWRGARPDASSGVREVEPNVLQPALLSNGTMMTWLTRLSDDHGLTAFALEPRPLDRFLDDLFLRLFTRLPTPAEKNSFTAALAPGFDTRITSAPTLTPPESAPRRKFVAWSNHMKSEANSLRLDEEAAARRGDPPTTRLTPDWRERFEDVIWSLLNAPEWTHIL